MTYWQFRRRLYQHALKQWLDSLTQVSTGIVALFPMAMYALLLLPLLALGVLGDKDASGQSYFFTLWGYLLLSYCWIGMQKEALTAAEHSLYDRALPVSARQRSLTDFGLLLYAANVFIAAPFVVLLVMVISHANELFAFALEQSLAQLYPLTTLLLLTFYYCYSALGNNRPWLSLGLLPLCAMPWAGQLDNPLLCVLIVPIAIVAERVLSLPELSLKYFPDGLWRLFLQQDLTHARPTVLRGVVILLVLIAGALFVQHINPEAKSVASAFFALVLGIITATKLLEVQSLRQHFALYLATLPVNSRAVTTQALGYCLAFSLPFVLLMLLFSLFALPQWALFLLTYLATQTGILLCPAYYLAFPLVTGAAVLMLSLLV